MDDTRGTGEVANVCQARFDNVIDMKKLVLLLAVGACAKTASSDLLTHGMSADIDAQAKGDGTTTVNATLYVGDPISLNFVELQGDDELLASFGSSQEQPMNRFELLNVVSYS